LKQSDRIFVCFFLLLIVAANHVYAEDQRPLFSWPAHQTAAARVSDTSGNGLDGESAASWTQAGTVAALHLDGRSTSLVRLQLSPSQAIGTGDWTFMTWLRPQELGYPGKQNQRRIFNYGKYPDASINIDITGRGELGWYLVYKGAGGRSVAAGGMSVPRIEAGTWIHVALVVDRHNGHVTAYLNGREAGQVDLPTGWAGDFKLGKGLTIGSGWQNFRGEMADIALWRRALTDAEIRSVFHTQVPMYGLKLGAGLTLDEALGDLLIEGNEAMVQRKFGQARTAFERVLATPGLPRGWAAWTELRIAQADRLEKKNDSARVVYQRIAADAGYLPHHRQEAAELLAELESAGDVQSAQKVMLHPTTLPAIRSFTHEIWVAPNGRDANPGTKDKPVGTLEWAQALARTLRGTGPIAVNLKDGEYRLPDTLRFTADDSGTPNAPVVWRAQHAGNAVIYGGIRLTNFDRVNDPAILNRIPAEARAHVLMCDLRQSEGLTDYGALAVRGYGQASPPPTLEVYEDGKPLTLARWPNEGFVNAGKLIEPGDKSKGIPSVFEYLDDRHARWAGADDAWMFGYFRYLWADATIKIGRIDTATHRITTAQAYSLGKQGMDAKQGIKYYVFNLLEELDRPGEWYLDRKAGRLYLWPTGDMKRDVIEVNVMSAAFVTMTNVSNLRWEGIVCDLGRGDGIRITGGQDVQLFGCTVSRVAGTGISINGGVRHMLLGCDVHHTGRAATILRGGKRETLERADFVVENCHLHDFGRIDRTYTPAIEAAGVGMRISHNLMHDGPSSAVRLDGNDMIVEYNDVHNVVTESDDQGAMESFGNPTFRGLIFRYNRFENIGNGDNMVAGQAAIRLDDVISGVLIYRNIFIRCASGHFGAVQINSGRDNIIDNNLFIDCKYGISGGWNKGNKIWSEAQQGTRRDFIRSDLYLQHYPDLSQMLDDKGRNFAWRNAFIDCGKPIRSPARFDVLALGAWTAKDAGIGSLSDKSWKIAPDSPIGLRQGLVPIPVEEIGLYPDRTRASLSPATSLAQLTIGPLTSDICLALTALPGEFHRDPGSGVTPGFETHFRRCH
jgi:hypothetical protein